MADEPGAAAVATNPPSLRSGEASDSPLSIDDALGLLAQEKPAIRLRQEATPGTAPDTQESTPQGEDTAAAIEQPPGETEEVETADEPAIDAPKSWTKAEKDAFATLPREHQQAIADRERERDSYYRKGHDEAAAKAKAAEAKVAEAEQARLRYEQALPGLLQQFQTQFAAEFQDIKSWDDVEEMQRDDPMRFMRWQTAQQKGQALQREAGAAQQRRQQEDTEKFATWQADQQKLFLEKAPEYADAAKATKLWADLRENLKETGVSDKELDGLYAGGAMPFHDHRTQLLLRDAMRYRAAQKAVKTAQPKPVPPVLRPGIASNKGEARAADIKILDDRLTRTGSLDDAYALVRAQARAAKK